MSDATETLFNKKLQQIVFYHQYTKSVLAFKAFLTNYSENWTNSWEEKELVRRLNKQYTFNAVYRTIQIGWELPAYDEAEAKLNLEKCTDFVRMLYPKIDKDGVVIGSNPVWFMSLMNIVHNAAASTGGTMANAEQLPGSGLKGFPSNVSWEPVLSEGVFDSTPGFILPKLIRVDERQRFGWQDTDSGGTGWTEARAWPWGVDGSVGSATSGFGGEASGASTGGGIDEPTGADSVVNGTGGSSGIDPNTDPNQIYYVLPEGQD